MVAADYINERAAKANGEVPTDEMLGLAVREACLNVIDSVFQQPGHDLRSFTTKVRLGKGVVVNESAIDEVLVKAVND